MFLLLGVGIAFSRYILLNFFGINLLRTIKTLHIGFYCDFVLFLYKKASNFLHCQRRFCSSIRAKITLKTIAGSDFLVKLDALVWYKLTGFPRCLTGYRLLMSSLLAKIAQRNSKIGLDRLLKTKPAILEAKKTRRSGLSVVTKRCSKNYRPI
jgi:hypothetical protein